MSRKFIASLTGCLLLGVFVCMPAMGDDDDSKPKITIKDVMKKGFNKRKGLLPKVTKGSATDEEKKELHEMFVALSKNKPPRGEEESWKKFTGALVKAGKMVVDGDEKVLAC